MRLLLQSHVYFLASFTLHAIIVLFLVFGTIHFGSQIESFEASIEFVNPKTQKKLESIAKSQKQHKESSGSIQTSTPLLSSKKLDDIIRAKGLKVNAGDNLDGTIEKKQSDLMGYLRANKLTKETTTKPQKKGSSIKSSNQLLKPEHLKEPSIEKTISTENNIDKSTTTNSTEQADEYKSGLSPARRIWQKKKEDNSYKQTLKKLVTANWTVPMYNKKEFQILIEAIIDINGNLKKIELLKSSGFPIIDTAAEKAIRVSTPFPKLPKILQEEKSEFIAVFRFTPDNVVR